MPRPYTFIRIAERLSKNEVRLFFSNGKVVELKLPYAVTNRMRIVDHGMGLDPGDGKEISSLSLADAKGNVLRPAVRTRGRQRANV